MPLKPAWFLRFFCPPLCWIIVFPTFLYYSGFASFLSMRQSMIRFLTIHQIIMNRITLLAHIKAAICCHQIISFYTGKFILSPTPLYSKSYQLSLSNFVNLEAEHPGSVTNPNCNFSSTQKESAALFPATAVRAFGYPLFAFPPFSQLYLSVLQARRH